MLQSFCGVKRSFLQKGRHAAGAPTAQGLWGCRDIVICEIGIVFKDPMYEVFAPLFTKSGWVSGQRPDIIMPQNKKKTALPSFFMPNAYLFFL